MTVIDFINTIKTNSDIDWRVQFILNGNPMMLYDIWEDDDVCNVLFIEEDCTHKREVFIRELNKHIKCSKILFKQDLTRDLFEDIYLYSYDKNLSNNTLIFNFKTMDNKFEEIASNTAMNEALRINIELVADIDLDKMKVISDERGLFIEGSFGKIMEIVRSLSDIDEILPESVLNLYTMCVDFEDCSIAFLRKEE